MANQRAELGQRGEDRAADWYRAHGYAVLVRNWRCTQGEIDLLCTTVSPERHSVLIVCEVKTRTTTSHGHPFEAVTPAKQHRLRRLATAYLRSQETRYDQVRFDVVALTGRQIDVMEGAF